MFWKAIGADCSQMMFITVTTLAFVPRLITLQLYLLTADAGNANIHSLFIES